MLRNGLFVLVGAVMVAGCTVPPSGVSEADVSRYLTAAASIGCEMKHESDYVPVEFQAGLTREQTLAITTYLVNRDQAKRLEDGGVQVTGGACA